MGGLFLTPSQARFGPVRMGNAFSLVLNLKNESIDLVRFSLRQPEDKRVRIHFETGAVPMGISRKLTFVLNATEPGKVETEVTIITKMQKLTIPVFAHIMDAQEFDLLNEEAIRKNKRG